MSTEASISTAAVISDTRGDFIRAAKRLFAERGFYGVSLAAIAEELGLTKQALIHHFGTKERLYGEVLAKMADRLSGVEQSARSDSAEPAKQLEALLLSLYRNAIDHPQDTQLLMRELLDNRVRAEHAHHWYMKDFLAAVAGMIRRGSPGKPPSETEALARVYLLLGAFNYFVISTPTLSQMYGPAGYEALKAQVPSALRRLARSALGA